MLVASDLGRISCLYILVVQTSASKPVIFIFIVVYLFARLAG
jgi:hypothetical protein